MSWKRSCDSSPPARTGTASRWSPLKEASVFELFSPPLVQALKERGFSSPTDPQVRLVPIVTEGKNALLMAPTGTGKTEAAILPILATLRWLVVDEIHELAEDKRGSQLAVGLERLRRLVKGDLQVIGLSATVGSPERIAEFLVGRGRECEILRVPVEKDLSLKVEVPRPTEADSHFAETIYSFPEVAARLRTIRENVEKYRSVLIFTNTRTEAEALANRFRVWDPRFPIGIHHSSLSKATREAVERDLKEGKLLGVICTSSLELGIDIGFLEFVIQYNSPRQVTRLIQRVGRSGYKIGRVSRGLVITQDSDDTLEAMVLCRRATLGELEPLEPFEEPYDSAVQQIAGLLIERGSWSIEEVYSLFRESYPYSTLSLETLKKLVTYMREGYPRLAFYREAENRVSRARAITPVLAYYI